MILKLGKGIRQFVGLLEKPSSPSQRHAWLFCSPYGQEAVRTAPLYRVMSERLSRAGHAVLRFDYYGCGDSCGDFGEGDLSHLIGDTLEAFEALQTYAASDSYSWFGLSLGGTVAAMAAASAPTAPGRVLLWKPVVDGAEYCEQLLATHRKELADELEADWQVLRQQNGLNEPSIPGNVLGSNFGDRFAAQLMVLRSLPLEQVLNRGVEVRIAIGMETAGVAGVAALSPRLHVVKTASDLNWMTGAAESTAVAPQEIVKFVMDAR